MTPAQQVAIDAMRSAWPEATVKAMLAGPDLLEAMCGVALEFGRDMDLDERDLFRIVSSALHKAHGHGVYESQRFGSEPIAREEYDRRETALAALSASAKSDGASAPHLDPDHLPGCYARPYPEGRGGVCSCSFGTPPAHPGA